MTNSLSRETVDKADDIKCCVVSPHGLWNSLHDQFHCHLLSCIQSHPICYNGELEKLNPVSALSTCTRIVIVSCYVHVQCTTKITTNWTCHVDAHVTVYVAMDTSGESEMYITFEIRKETT